MSGQKRRDNQRKVSRRNTLAATGIGLTGLAGGMTTLAQAQEEDAEPQAEVTFTDQQSDGESIVVDEIVLGDSVKDTTGFIKNSDGNTIGGKGRSPIDVTESVTDLEVPLDQPISESQELTVSLYEPNGPLLGRDSAFTTISTASQEDEQPSIQFIRNTAPTPGQTLREFTSSSSEGPGSPQVRVTNPPAEANSVHMLDVETGQEIRTMDPDDAVKGIVTLNGPGSVTFVLEEDRRDAKEEIEEQIRDSVVLELTEPFDPEADLRDFDGGFGLRFPSGPEKVTFVEGTDVELLFRDDERDQIGDSVNTITIGEGSTASQEEDAEPQAEVTFTDQQSDGESIVVDEIVLGDSVKNTVGFIEDSDGNTIGGKGESPIDVTESVTDLEVPLDQLISESQELTISLFNSTETTGSLLDEDSAFITITQESSDQESETTTPDNNQNTTETTPNSNTSVSASTASAETTERDLLIPGDGLASTDVDNRVIVTAVSAALSFFSMGYTFFGGDDD